jgi:hypothetical protein
VQLPIFVMSYLLVSNTSDSPHTSDKDSQAEMVAFVKSCKLKEFSYFFLIIPCIACAYTQPSKWEE